MAMAGEVAWRLGELLLLGLPAWLALGAAWLGGWRLRDVEWAGQGGWPAALSVAAGAGLGLALVAVGPMAAEFAPGRIFAPGAPWAMGLGEMLRGAAWPGAEALGRLLPRDAAGVLAVLAGLACAAALAGLWARGRGLPGWRGVAALMLLVLAGALGAHLLAPLGAWGVRRLNFWTFLVLLLAFQQWRWHRRWTRLGMAVRALARPAPTPG